MKTFAMGDIHGCYKALVQCLERSGFNKEEDLLITLGDIADGWSYVYDCVEELLTIKNRVDIMGNHDKWFIDYLRYATHPDYWKQGGHSTAKSYLRQIGKEHLMTKDRNGFWVVALIPEDVPPSHVKFFNAQQLYYERGKQLFVHAGIDRFRTLQENREDNEIGLYWDRHLWRQALSCSKGQRLNIMSGQEEIFIGHTTCSRLDKMRPVFAGGVWNLDTGAGWEGKLTIMDVDTKEFWQSDIVTDLYPEDTSRRYLS